MRTTLVSQDPRMKLVVVVTAFVLLSLLLSVQASAEDASIPNIAANYAERNRLFADAGMDLRDLAGMYERVISSTEGSSTEFSRACLEISRKAKEYLALNHRSLADKIDDIAATLCHITLNLQALEPKLGSCESCDACHNVMDGVNSVLGDTESQILVIVYLLKTCANQTNPDQCKKLAFSFAPMVISGVQSIVSADVCYFLRICELPRTTSKTQGADGTRVNGSMWPRRKQGTDVSSI